MIISRTCPMCGNTHYMEADDEKYFKYAYGGALVQDAFPEMPPTEREFIISGYCPECQELLFGSKYKGEKIK